MPIELADNHPWCSGLGYANADGRTKTWCMRRPPPHWWIVTLAGAVAPWEHFNAEHVLPLWKVDTGRDPMVYWEKRLPAPPTYQLSLIWQPHYEPDPRRFYIVVALDIARNLINATSWRSEKQVPIGNWMTLDDIDLTENVRSPLWQAGDITCNIKVGRYDRLPAHSCRGDWRGIWP